MDDLVGEVDMHINLDKIKDITNNFADDRLIAKGGYGTVYTGLYHGQKIAVKRLHHLIGLDDRAFNNEVAFNNVNEVHSLCKIRHPNIVQLIGYCYEVHRKFMNYEGKINIADEMEIVLCFEFVEGGDLEKHITAEPCGLNWPTCFKIIKDTCVGLHHLHSKRIYHLDLKPANILLDKLTNTAKIGDFGLSRLDISTLETQNTQGTCGFMPVEYINEGIISNRFDVFSLGVLIIQIMAGTNGNDNRSAMPRDHFIKLVTTKWKGRLLRASGHSSAREIDIFQVETCIKIALRCVDPVRDKRPKIKDIIRELQGLEPRVHEISFDYPDMSQGLIGLQELHVVVPVSKAGENCHPSFDVRSAPSSRPPLPPSLIHCSQWEKKECIGRGSFGVVYRGFNSEHGQSCAIEEVLVISNDPHSEENLRELNKEINILKQCSHPNIVPYYGSNVIDTTLSIYMEYLSEGSIHKLLANNGPFKESTIRSYTAQILKGLAFLHERKHIHRDIKGANILVGPNNEVKLADFGLAKHIATLTAVHTSCRGTPCWMAPEVILSSCSGEGYNLSADIWSLGCTVGNRKASFAWIRADLVLYRYRQYLKLPMIKHIYLKSRMFCQMKGKISCSCACNVTEKLAPLQLN